VSRIADLVGRGVRVIVGDHDGAAPEVPSDFFETSELRSFTRSEISADVQDFVAVYAEAKVPPPVHGYGIDQMAEILESRRLASLPQEVRVAAVLASLDAARVSLPQVIRDAVLRGRALDSFVAAKQREVEALRMRNEARVSALRAEIESFVDERNHEVEELQSGSEKATSAFSQLQLRKRQEEERLHAVLSHFVNEGENPLPAAGSHSRGKGSPRNGG
jgi:hypothetical protein